VAENRIGRYEEPSRASTRMRRGRWREEVAEKGSVDMSACHWGVDDDDDELAIGVELSSRTVTYTILNQHKTYICVSAR
jgi:hypothetical protein